MQDSIQKLWSDSVEVEGIAASMVLRKTDIQYINSSLSILKTKIAELDSLVNSIQLDNNETHECTPPTYIPKTEKPLYREILKETIVIESSRHDDTACQVETQPVDPILPEPQSEQPTVEPEHLLVEDSDIPGPDEPVINAVIDATPTPSPEDETAIVKPDVHEPKTIAEIISEKISENIDHEQQNKAEDQQPDPDIVTNRPILDSSIVDEDIRDEQTYENYADVAIEPDPDTEPAVEGEPEFEPVLDPEPEPEPEPEPQHEPEPAEPQQLIEQENAVASTSIDNAVESEEKLEESIAQQIEQVENPEAAPADSSENSQSEDQPATTTETASTDEVQPDAQPINPNVQPQLPEERPQQAEQDDQPQNVEPNPSQDNNEAQPEGPISLDQKLSRKISKNFRQAISLNDKFRFRRELFGNSSQQYDAALDLIEEMTSFDEARDYFLDNYGWDADNDDVKSFFEILSNHFNS